MTADKKMRTITCIQCPLGCMVSVGLADDGTVDSVEGAACARGRSFASEGRATCQGSYSDDTGAGVSGSVERKNLKAGSEKLFAAGCWSC